MIKENIFSRAVLVAAFAGLSLACSTAHSTIQSGAPPTAPAVANSNPTPPPPPQSEDDKMPRTSGADALKMFKAGEAIIVDVRSEDSYRMSHAKGAISVPLDKIEKGDHKLPKDKKIISYCT